LQADPVIVNAQIAVTAALDGIGPHCADLLRHHADISPLAAVIGEAVIAQAVLEMTEQHDVVLEGDVRATSASAAPATAATTESSASAAAESATSAAADTSSTAAERGALAAAACDTSGRRPELSGA